MRGIDPDHHPCQLHIGVDLFGVLISPQQSTRQLPTIELDDLDGAHVLHQTSAGFRLRHDALLAERFDCRNHRQPQRRYEHDERQHHRREHGVEVKHHK